MTMERNKDLEKLLGEMLSPDTADIESPHASLVYTAREKILARKKVVREPVFSFSRIIEFFKLEFRFYHVGLSVLLISIGMFYVNDSNYSSQNSPGFSQYNDALSIKNTTISVNSSTMLTSIPTLVIRN
jgi:hypothetical protein